MTTLLGLLLLLTPCVAFSVEAKTAQSGSRTITQVVDLLQSMLEKSKADGKTERNLYAKYKCYCDTNTEEKTGEIKTLTEQIDILESKIEELQSSTGSLSEEVAKLKAAMEANQASQDDATTLREKRGADYLALKSDLNQAVTQMGSAINTLAAIGADQTMEGAAEDHKYAMAGFGDASMLKMKTSVKQALLAASALVEPSHLKNKAVLESFIQAPFTGTYSSQSGEVVGILKDMRDTFRANLAAARETENKEVKAFNELMSSLKSSMAEMKESTENKQGMLSSNDGELATKKTQLDSAVEDKAEAEEFLSNLTDMCTKKASEYAQRTRLRANEDAAVAEAISILNSDAAFASFGKVDATSSGSTGPALIQRAMIRKHRQLAPQVEARQVVQKFLASKPQTGRIVKVEAMIQAQNPFQTVLDEIKKMLALIVKEEKHDVEEHKWCEDEQTKHNDIVDDKTKQINTLKGEIDELEDTINHPITGLLIQISEAETDLEENTESQKTETKERTEDNQAYQKDIANLQEAHELLSKAVKVLKDYYSTIMKEALVQKSSKQTPPETWDSGADQSKGAFAGQSGKGGDAISMLEFILSETEKEEEVAHTQEQGAQHDFEDSMSALTTGEKELLESIAKLKGELSQAQEDLMLAEKDLHASEEVKAKSEDYLAKIERQCTWIQDNLVKRQTARADETTALESAVTVIKGTPAYTTAVQAQKEEDFGDCKETCVKAEAHVDCQACLAKTSVPGFCAGHKATPGC